MSKNTGDPKLTFEQAERDFEQFKLNVHSANDREAIHRVLDWKLKELNGKMFVPLAPGSSISILSGEERSKVIGESVSGDNE